MLVLLVMTLALLVPGCAGTHGNHREVPIPLTDQHERMIGSRLSARFETNLKANSDPIVNDYVSQLGQKIARLSDRPDIPYTFRVFDDPDPKAIAFPGGEVYISSGLLQRIDSECQLAGVLAHEIAHVSSRQAAGLLEKELEDAELAQILLGPKGADTTAAGGKALALLAVGYRRDVESQADDTALLYVSRMGLNPEGLIQVIEKLNPTSAEKEVFWEPLAGGHPTPAQRVLLLRAELKSMGLDAGLPHDLHPYAPVKNRLK